MVKERKRVVPSNTSPQAYLARDAIPEEAIEVSASEVMVNGLFKLPNGQKWLTSAPKELAVTYSAMPCRWIWWSWKTYSNLKMMIWWLSCGVDMIISYGLIFDSCFFPQMSGSADDRAVRQLIGETDVHPFNECCTGHKTPWGTRSVAGGSQNGGFAGGVAGAKFRICLVARSRLGRKDV